MAPGTSNSLLLFLQNVAFLKSVCLNLSYVGNIFSGFDHLHALDLGDREDLEDLEDLILLVPPNSGSIRPSIYIVSAT